MKCIVCGKKADQEIKMPHGSFHLCYDSVCLDKLTLTLHSGSFPVVWICPEDLRDFNEDFTDEEYKALESGDMIGFARDMCDSLWNNYFGDTFRETADYALESWREQSEKALIERTPPKDLPLLINTIKYDRNKIFFSERLKHGK